MFRHRLPLRRWAARVLLLWLFGIGSGVANACLMPNPAQPAGGVIALALDGCASHHGSGASVSGHHAGLGHVQAAEAAADHQAWAIKSNCQDFCDKASVSLPSLKAAPDGALGPASLPVAAAIVLPGPALVPSAAWVPRRDGVRAPSIPIAFLRLAL